MNSNNSNWIKAYIIDVLPFMSIALYILALLYNITFYSVFNINVIPYMSLSEALLSIVESLLTFSLFVGVISFFLFAWEYVFLPQEIKKFGPQNKWFKRYKKSKRLKFFNVWIKYEIKSSKRSSFFVYVVPSIIMLLSFSLFDCITYYLIDGSDYIGNMHLGMCTPAFVFFMILTTITETFPNIAKSLFELIKALSASELIAIIVIYYVYLVFVFLSGGIKNGEYIKDNPTAAFEIETIDQTVYKDSCYSYIGNTKDFIFLMEKNTDNRIILGNQSIVYCKINHKYPTTFVRLFTNFRNSFKESSSTNKKH